jgi:hypothetical protein
MAAARFCQASRSSRWVGTGPSAEMAQAGGGRRCVPRSGPCGRPSARRSRRRRRGGRDRRGRGPAPTIAGTEAGPGCRGGGEGGRRGRRRCRGIRPGPVRRSPRPGLGRGPGRPVRRHAGCAIATEPGGQARRDARAAVRPEAGRGSAARGPGVVSAVQMACSTARWSASARAWLRVWVADRCWPSWFRTAASTPSAVPGGAGASAGAGMSARSA